MKSYRDRALAILWVFLALGLLSLSVVGWPERDWLSSDFQALLPAGSSDIWVGRANSQAAFAFDGQLVVLVESDDAEESSQFLEYLRDELSSGGFIDADFSELEAQKWHALATALYPYRWNLLTTSDRLALEQDANAYLDSFRRRVYTPLGAALAETLPTDPMGTYRNFLSALMPEGVSSTVDDLPEGVLFAVYSVPPGQRGLETNANLYSAYSRLKERAARDGVGFYATGAPLFSAYGALSARQEISTIGVVSLLLLVGLQLALLRSPTAIGLTLLSVAMGMAGGIAITVLVLRQIHVLTLVFGTTIIGIAVDYSYHYLAHSLLPGWSREKALSQVISSLSLGALSTCAAFLALTFMPFPGIRQIGVFMAMGLIFSFLTVFLLFPLLYCGAPQGAKLPTVFSRAPIAVNSLRVPMLIALLAVPGWLLLTPLDDVRTFYGKPSELSADEAVIRKRMSVAADSRYLLVRGDSREAVMVTEEWLLQMAGTPGREFEKMELRGISSVVPSVATQRSNYALIMQLLESGALAKHLETLGFVQAYQDKVLSSIPVDFKPLQPTDLDSESLPSGMGRFLGCENSVCASWVAIAGHGDFDQSMRELRDNPAVQYVDPIGDINSLLATYRQEVLMAMLGGTLSVLTILCLFYGWRRSIGLLLLPVISCLLTVAAIGYLHGSYTIIHLLALMLIFGVSMDYSIFRGFSTTDTQPAVTFAIALSALTSTVAFGMLAFSQTPLISAFGEAIALGLFFAYGLSWLRFEWRD